MAGFDFSFKKLKGGFFDPSKILAGLEKAEVKLQSRFGANTRRTMKSSIRYKAKGSAPAGSPPFAHRSNRFTRQKTNKKTGAVTRQGQSPLRELIFFARDPDTNSVVIGPVVFGQRGAGALEKGGTTTTRDPRTGLTKTVRIAPHPFARPAGAAEAAKLPDLLRQMIN
jgi:hypothetical protein